jgi:hypothetical protein
LMTTAYFFFSFKKCLKVKSTGSSVKKAAPVDG